jgi:hypothetical protein
METKVSGNTYKSEVRKPLSYKLSILDILRRNNYNIYATSNETGVSQSTIKFWNLKHGPTMKEALETDVSASEVVIESLSNMEVVQNHFTEQAVRVKGKVLNRIERLIMKEKDMKKLTDAVKVLHLITNPELNKTVFSPYEEVFTQFLLEGPKGLTNGKENNKFGDPGDTEE